MDGTVVRRAPEERKCAQITSNQLSSKLCAKCIESHFERAGEQPRRAGERASRQADTRLIPTRALVFSTGGNLFSGQLWCDKK